MELMEYNFQLVHILGKKNGHTNTFSRCPDYDQGDNDNKNLTVLPPKFFKKVYTNMITRDKKEERTPLSKDQRKSTVVEKEERTPSA